MQIDEEGIENLLVNMVFQKKNTHTFMHFYIGMR
jgi:hypothetical protein